MFSRVLCRESLARPTGRWPHCDQMAVMAPDDTSDLISRRALVAASAQSPAWSEVTRLSDGSFRVRLGGSFGQGWLASLCRGLADKRISIERAHAMRTRNLAWIAEFTALPLEGA